MRPQLETLLKILTSLGEILLSKPESAEIVIRIRGFIRVAATTSRNEAAACSR